MKEVEFAREIVDRFHGAGAGERALADFEARFRQHSAPDVVEEVILTAPDAGIPIANALKQAGLTETRFNGIFSFGSAARSVLALSITAASDRDFRKIVKNRLETYFPYAPSTESISKIDIKQLFCKYSTLVLANLAPIHC